MRKGESFLRQGSGTTGYLYGGKDEPCSLSEAAEWYGKEFTDSSKELTSYVWSCVVHHSSLFCYYVS